MLMAVTASFQRPAPTRREPARRQVIAIRIAVVLPMVAMLAFFAVLSTHEQYNGLSPGVRVTIAGGCPRDLGPAIDVKNPNPQNWVSSLSRHPPLASPGADAGLICEYSSSATGSHALQRHVQLTAAQAGTLSVAAAAAATKPLSGVTACAAAAQARPVIVVLGYSHQADVDIWWDDAGCQAADNGYATTPTPGDLSYVAFADAVTKYLPAAS